MDVKNKNSLPICYIYYMELYKFVCMNSFLIGCIMTIAVCFAAIPRDDKYGNIKRFIYMFVLNILLTFILYMMYMKVPELCIMINMK